MQPSPGASHIGPALYSLIHKGIRTRLFKFSISAGRMDYANNLKLDEFYNEYKLLVKSIRLHHSIEEGILHPVISDRIPGGAVRLEDEHRLVDQQMDQLMAHLESTKSKTAAFERNKDLSLEFYLAFNRFLAFFLRHLDDEEERVQRSLFDLCTIEELVNTFRKTFARQKPEELMDNLKMVLSGANLDDFTGLFIGAKALMPPEGYQKAARLAESILDPEDWSALKTRAGINLPHT